MAASALSVLPSAPSLDLGEFVNRHNRLPRLGDGRAPWHYRGWLLAYVILVHERCPSVADRWGYHLRTLEAGRLLDEPIPQIAFGPPDKRVASQLHKWSAIIGHDCGGWSDFRTLLDWLLWGLALSKEEPHLTDQVNEKLLGSMAARLLRIFLQSDFARPKGVILGVEEELRGQIIPGCPDLLARVDLIVDEGEAVHVADFKTARCSWNDYKVDDIAPQLLLYSELVKPIADGRPVKLSFAVLTKTKIPVMTLHDVPVGPRQIDRTKRTVERIWRAIQSGHFYPNPSPFTCGSCPFRDPCRRWNG